MKKYELNIRVSKLNYDLGEATIQFKADSYSFAQEIGDILGWFIASKLKEETVYKNTDINFSVNEK